MRNPWLRALGGYAWGLILFLVVGWSLRLLLGSTTSGSVVLSQVVFKTVLIVVALLGWKLMGRPLGDMGWRRADWWNRSYLIWFLLTAVSMTAGSFVNVFLGARHPLASQMSFLQIVLAIWVLSSFSEEVYVRGLIQSWVADRDDATGLSSPFGPTIVSSALLFASMHVPLMWSPVGPTGGLVIVLSTLGVGFACAVLRAQSRSLWPAILCHVAGNVAGLPGGIFAIVLYRLVHGRMPEFVNG